VPLDLRDQAVLILAAGFETAFALNDLLHRFHAATVERRA
jgi:hypothetical protein